MKTTNGQVLTIFWNLAMDTLLSPELHMKLWLLAVLESMFKFDKIVMKHLFQQSNRSMGLDFISTKETGYLSQDQLLLDVPCLIFSRGISLFIKLYIL